MVYIRRVLETAFLRSDKSFPVLLVSGPRQVGKSTMLTHLAGTDRTYVTLDDPLVRQAAKASPANFFAIYEPPILLDEVQYAPELFPYIKIIVDQRQEAGLFWLTGSQMFPLMDQVKESLAGRVAVMNLYPFSRNELSGRASVIFPPEEEALVARSKQIKIDDVDEAIFRGGMPRLALEADMDQTLFFSSYLQTYVDRDVRDISQIRESGLFINFVRQLATRTAQELNLASIAVAVGIDPTTARRWLNILLLSGIVFELRPWSNNLGKRLSKRPKIYFTDTGFCSYLCGFESAGDMGTSLMAGALYENFIVTEICKSWIFEAREAPVFYYRDNKQKEIDLIVQRNQKLYPFEIKRSHSPSHAFKNWSVLGTLGKEIGYSGVICSGDQLLPAGDNRWLIPWQLI